MTAQERMIRGLSKCCEEWAKDLAGATSATEYVRRLITIGRLEGLAIGLTAIADIAADDDTLPADHPQPSK